MDVQQLTETTQIAFRDCIADLKTDVLDFAQAPDDSAVLRARSCILLFQDGGGVAHLMRIEHQNVVLEALHQIHIQVQAFNTYVASRINIERRQTTKGRHVLILFSDWFS